MNEYEATNIDELTRAFISITKGFDDSHPLWRGHGDESWKLVPGIYRPELTEEAEYNLTGRFRLGAEARYDKCPGQGDFMGWLSLMQHYRLPTRLLDWSESPLVALFFALEESSTNDDDAVIWAVAPAKLNQNQIGSKFIPNPDHSTVQKLSSDAFMRSPANPDSRTVAVLAKQTDLRHLIQKSAFTIHGSDKPIEELSETESFLTKIRIPAASKEYFRNLLDLYRISRASLFPDLENLAKDVASIKFVTPA